MTAVSGTTLNGESNFTFDGTSASISGHLSVNGGSGNQSNDASVYITATDNSDWGLRVDKYNGSASDYGVQIDVGSGAGYALRIRGNDAETCRIYGNGNIVSQGSIDSASDLKLKTNIKTIDNALDKTLKLRGVEFDRTDRVDHQIGVIAQEVEKIIPEVVHGDEIKSVTYGNLVGLLIEAIKELKKEIDDLKSSK